MEVAGLEVAGLDVVDDGGPLDELGTLLVGPPPNEVVASVLTLADGGTDDGATLELDETTTLEPTPGPVELVAPPNVPELAKVAVPLPPALVEPVPEFVAFSRGLVDADSPQLVINPINTITRIRELMVDPKLRQCSLLCVW